MLHAWEKRKCNDLIGKPKKKRLGDQLEDLEVKQSTIFTRTEWGGNWIRLLRARNTGRLLRT